MSSIWYEKYKPSKISDLVLPENLKTKLQQHTNNEDIPNLGLFSRHGGTGKSATSHAIVKEIGGEALWINASLERGIDTLRGKIGKFASQNSFDDKIKIVVMDECLEENEKVRIGTLEDWEGVKLNELTKGVIYPCVSFNMDSGVFENDTCEIISDKFDDVFLVTLEDGREVKVTGNHPFIVLENGKYIEKSINDGLQIKDGFTDSDDVVVFCVGSDIFAGTTKVTLITQMVDKSRVINLTVHKNHTFVTENGIVTHNCDHLSSDAQAAFRGFIDEYSRNCRFILTGNYPEKIIEPLLNRLEVYDFNQFDSKEMIKPIYTKLEHILKEENITYDPKDIARLIKASYPSIRAMISNLQKFSSTGTLVLSEADLDSSSSFDTVMKSTKYMELIQNVNALSAPESMFTFLYQNLDVYFKDSEYQKVVITIAKYAEMSSSVRDKHLNLSACLTELWGLRK